MKRSHPENNLEINRHLDDVGKDDMNHDLLQKRADAVKTYLTVKGIEASRMTAKGFGETIPVADNKTSDGRALNRRLEHELISGRNSTEWAFDTAFFLLLYI